MLHQQTTFSNTDITVISRAGAWVYRVGYYDDNATILQNVVLVHRDDTGRPVEIIEAGSAIWGGSFWTLRNVRHFMAQDSQTWTERSETELVIQDLDESPETFRSQHRDIREMSADQLRRYAVILARAGLPSGTARAESQRRLSFSFATVLVTLMSIGTVGWFRKNLLLASLLVSLISATVYYVAQMVGMLMARTGDIPPAVGAWLPPVFFAILSIFLVARTRR
jgi:lipopolysaccharide export system permease protein